jgi:hypothetical protein
MNNQDSIHNHTSLVHDIGGEVLIYDDMNHDFENEPDE